MHTKKNFIIVLTVIISLFSSTSYAKLLDIVDLITGGDGFEAGDSITGPVVVDTTVKQQPIQALKYNNGIKTTASTNKSPSSSTVASTDVVSYTPINKNQQSKVKEKEDDDPLISMISGTTSSVTGSHASTFSFPSFSFSSFGTTSTAPAYTTDSSVLQSELNTPETTIAYMNSYFTYSNHDGSTPYDPATFNSLRSGDCKDYATFFGWALEDDGWEVHTIDYQYGSSSGHVISLFQGSDGKWYAQSNSTMVGPISSTEDAISQTMPAGGTLGSYREFPAGYTGTYSWK